MKINISSRVSEEFHEQVKTALASFPDYYSCLDTTIALGPRIKSIFPDIRADWRNLVMMHRSKTNTIGFAEYGRTPSLSPFLRKNTRTADGIAHESGHVFDLRVFGHAEKREYFSLRENGSFMQAWEADVAYLESHPECYSSLDKQFSRHMVRGGFGTKETFAEIWANAHGYSALHHVGIEEIKSYFPRSASVIDACIDSL